MLRITIDRYRMAVYVDIGEDAARFAHGPIRVVNSRIEVPLSLDGLREFADALSESAAMAQELAHAADLIRELNKRLNAADDQLSDVHHDAETTMGSTTDDTTAAERYRRHRNEYGNDDEADE